MEAAEKLQDKRIVAPEQAEQTMLEHLTCLRHCFLKSLAALVAGTLVCAYFIDIIVGFMVSSVGQLYYMRPAEAFMIYMKLAVGSGFVVASPIIFYQIWAFVLPALTRKEKQGFLLCFPISLLLFLGGIGFGYFIVFPRALQFFMSFAGGNLSPIISMEAYLDFMLMLVLPFGFIFTLPVVLVFLAYLGVMTSERMLKYWRHTVFASFVVAAVVTPTPDIFTQLLLAAPMVVLYFASIGFTKYILRK